VRCGHATEVEVRLAGAWTTTRLPPPSGLVAAWPNSEISLL
jgi:hypothetical protein